MRNEKTVGIYPTLIH